METLPELRTFVSQPVPTTEVNEVAMFTPNQDIIEAAERLPPVDEHAHENEKAEDAKDTHPEPAGVLPQVDEGQADVANAEGELPDAQRTVATVDNKSDEDANDLEREATWIPSLLKDFYN